MNLFRSEEHALAWRSYNPEYAQGMQSIHAWLERFSGAMFRERGRPDYITWYTAWRAAQSR